MTESFSYQEIFKINDDKIEYEKVYPFEGKLINFNKKKFLFVKESSLQKFSKLAFYNISHYLRSSHLSKLKKIITDNEASNNDKCSIFTLKKCQYCGRRCFTNVSRYWYCNNLAKKGINIITSGKDAYYLSQGVYKCYLKK